MKEKTIDNLIYKHQNTNSYYDARYQTVRNDSKGVAFVTTKNYIYMLERIKDDEVKTIKKYNRD